jgi:CBS domain-containing protein
MTRHGTTHLLVVDEPGRAPVGVLSTMDILEALALRDDGSNGRGR